MKANPIIIIPALVALLHTMFMSPAAAQPDGPADALAATPCTFEQPISYVGDAVAKGLADYAWRFGSHNSSFTRCNRTDHRWLYITPDVRQPPALDATEAFYEVMAQEIAGTVRQYELLNLTFTLDPAHGGDPGRSAFEEFIAPAFKALHDRLENGHELPRRPLIRLGYDTGDLMNNHPEVEQVMAAIERAMVDPTGTPIPQHDWNFFLIIRGIGQHPWVPWNHSKVAVRDRQSAISGGHTFYNDWLNEDDPIYDVSLRLAGDGAKSAGDFVERLWRRGRELNAGDCVLSANFPAGFLCHPVWSWEKWAADILATSWVPSPPPPPLIHSGVPVASLGRSMTDDGAGPPGEARPDLSADVALLAAIEAARSHVYLSQHTLMNPTAGIIGPPYSEPLFDALAGLIEHGKRVHILISSPWRMPFPARVSPYAVWSALTEHISDYLKAKGYSEPVIEQLLCKLKVAPFKATGPQFANRFHSHAKYVQIDQRAFYVGAQNLYPGGFFHNHTPAPGQPELSEHGFLVDDSWLTLRMESQYWTPVWTLSEDYVVGNLIYQALPTRQVDASADDAGETALGNCEFNTAHNEVYFGACQADGSPITSGLRFTGIDIPRGAIITYAALRFTTDGPFSDPIRLRVRGERSADAAPFSSASKPSDRAMTAAAAPWVVSSLAPWDLGDTAITPDLSAVVQEIIDQPAWQAGNALALVVQDDGSAGSRRVVGFDRPVWYPGTEYAAELIIFYGVVDPGVCADP